MAEKTQAEIRAYVKWMDANFTRSVQSELFVAWVEVVEEFRLGNPSAAVLESFEDYSMATDPDS